MPDLGNAVLRLIVNDKGFKQGLDTSQKKAEAAGGRMSRSIGKVGEAWGKMRQGAADYAKQMPIVGGIASKAILAMTGPIGLVVTALAGMGIAAAAVVKGVGNVAKETAILRHEVGLSAESAQGWVAVAKEMGAEGDDITDMFREMGIRLGELSATGAGPAKDALAAIGVTLEDLQGLAPEQQFALLHEGLLNVEDSAQRAFLAEELFGGSVERAGLLLNTQTDELLKSVDAFAENNAHSAKTIDAQEELSKLWQQAKQALAPVTREIAAALIPALRDFMAAIVRAKPLITTLISIGLAPLKQAINVVSTALNVVTALLRGDVTGALNHIRNFFIETADTILSVGAKVVRLFNEDMANAIEGTRADLQALKVEAQDSAVTFDQDFSSAQRTAAEVTTAVAEAADKAKKAIEKETEAAKDAAHWVEQWRLKTLGARQEADIFRLSLGEVRTGFDGVAQAADAAAQAQREYADAAQKAADDAVAAYKKDLEFWLWKNQKMAEHREASRKAEAERQRRQKEQSGGGGGGAGGGGGRSSSHGRKAGHDGDDLVDIFRGAPRNSWTENPYARHLEIYVYNGGDLSKKTGTGYPRAVGRRSDNAAQQHMDAYPGLFRAQHGAYVKGSQFGKLIRVGENFTDEGIFPLNERGLRAATGGMSGNGGGRREYPIYIGDEKLTTLVLNAQNELVDTGRA